MTDHTVAGARIRRDQLPSLLEQAATEAGHSDVYRYDDTMRPPNRLLVHRVGTERSTSGRVVVEIGALAMSATTDGAYPPTLLGNQVELHVGVFLDAAQARSAAMTLLDLAEQLDGAHVDLAMPDFPDSL